MKNLSVYKKFIIFFTPVILVATLLTGCEDEDPLLPRTGKPTITITNKNITVSEGQDINLNFKLSYPIELESHVRIEVAGGTATDHDDFVIDLDTMEDYSDGFFGGNGYFYEILGETTDVTLPIETIVDGIAEGTETLTLKFYSASQGRAIIDETVEVKIND